MLQGIPLFFSGRYQSTSNPVLKQSKTDFNTSNSATPSFSWSSGPTQNNLLILALVSDTTISSVTGWTLAINSTANCATAIYYKVAGASETTTITVNLGSSDVVAVAMYEYSGFPTSGILDQVDGNTGQGGGGTFACGPTPNTTQAREYVFAVAGSDTSVATLTSWNNSYTALNNIVAAGQTANITIATAFLLVSSTGAQSTTATFTSAGTGNDATCMATFKY